MSIFPVQMSEQMCQSDCRCAERKCNTYFAESRIKRYRAEGAKSLAEVLKVNKTLTSLNLGANNIGYEGVKAVAEVLKVNTTLTSLI